MIYAICRHWGQSPQWFRELAGEEKHLIIADYILTHQTKEQAQEQQETYNRKVIARARKNWG